MSFSTNGSEQFGIGKKEGWEGGRFLKQTHILHKIYSDHRSKCNYKFLKRIYKSLLPKLREEFKSVIPKAESIQEKKAKFRLHKN